MILVVLTIIFVVFTSIYWIRKQKKRKSILITGHKSTGKTVLTNYLTDKKHLTVPSLVSYTVMTPKYEITDQRITDRPIDKKYDLIICMFVSNITALDGNVIYVNLGEKKKEINELVGSDTNIKNSDVFYLSNDMKNIHAIISKRV